MFVYLFDDADAEDTVDALELTDDRRGDLGVGVDQGVGDIAAGLVGHLGDVDGFLAHGRRPCCSGDS